MVCRQNRCSREHTASKHVIECNIVRLSAEFFVIPARNLIVPARKQPAANQHQSCRADLSLRLNALQQRISVQSILSAARQCECKRQCDLPAGNNLYDNADHDLHDNAVNDLHDNADDNLHDNTKHNIDIVDNFKQRRCFKSSTNLSHRQRTGIGANHLSRLLNSTELSSSKPAKAGGKSNALAAR